MGRCDGGSSIWVWWSRLECLSCSSRKSAAQRRLMRCEQKRKPRGGRQRKGKLAMGGHRREFLTGSAASTGVCSICVHWADRDRETMMLGRPSHTLPTLTSPAASSSSMSIWLFHIQALSHLEQGSYPLSATTNCIHDASFPVADLFSVMGCFCVSNPFPL